jgi:hypothetical protein
MIAPRKHPKEKGNREENFCSLTFLSPLLASLLALPLAKRACWSRSRYCGFIWPCFKGKGVTSLSSSCGADRASRSADGGLQV